jgi:hypothetical protein
MIGDDDIELDQDAFDAAVDAATDAFVAGGEEQEQLTAALKAYLRVVADKEKVTE